MLQQLKMKTAMNDRRSTTASKPLRRSLAPGLAALWLVMGSGAFLGPLRAESPPASPPGAKAAAEREAAARAAAARGERPVAPTPTDLAARERFLTIERFARLPDDQQGKGLPEFYRQFAPYFLNSIIEGILSSYPNDILDPRAGGYPGGEAKARWAAQLAGAAATLTPEEVADKLAIRLWLDVAGRARTIQLLKQHPDALASLVAEDLASQNLAAVKRACTAISDLRLRQFTDKVLALYLADTPLSAPAQTALIWLGDPAIVRPLLEEVEKNPKSLARHAGLFQGPLAGQPAEPSLLKLLDSPDPDLRYHAAYALSECRDAALAKPVAKLAKETELRLRSAALTLALRLPNEAFAGIHDDLTPLISAPEESLQLEAITCFSRRKDLLAGPPLLRRLQQDRMDPGQAVTVMQALNAMADSAFSYDMHNWGPKANAKAIARFEAWLRQRGVPVGPDDAR
jgi:hypothetical protein